MNPVKVFVYIFVLVALMLLFTACTAKCVKPIVSLPFPELPKISSEELQCLSGNVYNKLANRDLLLQSAFLDCKAIVDELTEE